MDPLLAQLLGGWPRRSGLPAPWVVVPAELRTLFEAELAAEVSPGHPLFGQQVTALVRCEGCDEVVFAVEPAPVRPVSVHRTWRRAAEPPPWPLTGDLVRPLRRGLAAHRH
jgi:hypothetical protein